MLALSRRTHCLLGTCLMGIAGSVCAQQATVSAENVVSLEASAEVRLAQDWLSMSLATTREGGDAAQVQSALKSDVARALDVARREGAKAGEALVQVHTSGFSLYPRAGQNGKPMTWQGTAGIVLQGTDIGAVSALAGRIPQLTVRQVEFGLSAPAREQAEKQARLAAIANFRERAAEVTKAFGFSSYRLGEIQVGGASGSSGPLRPMAAMAMRADAAPVPVEAGQSTVSVTVSGSIRMH